MALIVGSATWVAGADELAPAYQQRGPMSFDVFDDNHDGLISAEEHARQHAQRYNWRAAQGYPMRNAGNAPVFNDMDSDRDGAVNRGEFYSWQSQHRQNPMMQGRRGW